MAKLVIDNLHVVVDDKEILKGINLVIDSKEVHALLGPNGNGKSTLLQTIMGNPRYIITKGAITYDDININELPVDQRSRNGIFLAMQYPVEIGGITNSDFMRFALNTRVEQPIKLFEFIKQMDNSLKTLNLKSEFAHRFINEGFSGGEKKRNEIVQMLLLKPSFAMLDEIDSGLDVDALKIVADVLTQQINQQPMAMLIVSHYERFYQLLKPSIAHVMIDGKIACSGDMELITRIDQEGYDWLLQEMNLQLAKAPQKQLIYRLGVCGLKEMGNQK